MQKIDAGSITIPAHYCKEYRLTGIGCFVLNETAAATGTHNVSGGGRLTFTALTDRVLTVDRGNFARLAPGLEIFLYTTPEDPGNPRRGRIAAVDPETRTITLASDPGIPAASIAAIGRWIGAVPDLVRISPAFAAGQASFAVGLHAAAVGCRVATGADASFIVGRDGQLPGTPDFDGAFAVAWNGALPLLFKTGELIDNPDAAPGAPAKIRRETVSLRIAGRVEAEEFVRADGSPVTSGSAAPILLPLDIPADQESDFLHLEVDFSDSGIFDGNSRLDTRVSSDGVWIFDAGNYIPFPAAGAGPDSYGKIVMIDRTAMPGGALKFHRARWRDGAGNLTPWRVK